MSLDLASDPYAVPDDLAARIDALDLRQNVRDMVDTGYTILQDPVAHALTDRLRDAILRLSVETEEGPIKGRNAGLLLGRDPVFAEAVLVPKMLAMAEFLVGRGMLLSQLIGSVRREGAAPLGLHADNSWFPEPFPSWEMMCTACWVTDEFTLESGATLIIPGTHKQKRHPPRDVRKTLENAIPIVAPKGSICMWDGSVWHGNYSRQLPGERVVLHTTYTRIGLETVEDYRHLGDDWLADKPPEMAGLLGRKLFFGSTTATSGATNPALLQNTYRLVHGPRGY
jgi:Protein involved in biosynthesis of mitomycin antibiotics/polyketide fumonisin